MADTGRRHGRQGAELERLGGGKSATAKTGISVEAAILNEEAGLVEASSLEGLVEGVQGG